MRTIVHSTWDMLQEVSIADLLTRAFSRNETKDNYNEVLGYIRVSDELVEFIAKHDPVIEIGAGRGHLAAKLKENTGCSVRATDFMTTHIRPEEYGKYYPVEKAEARDVVIASSKDQTILLSWPGYNDGWAYEAVREMKIGQKLIYIGEGPGGCCADDEFHQFLIENFEQIDEHEVDRFDMTYDHCWVFRRAK